MPHHQTGFNELSIKTSEKIGLRCVGLFEKGIPAIKWSEPNVYPDPEYRWSEVDSKVLVNPEKDRYSFDGYATMLGRTHIKDAESGEYLNLNALDIDCETVYNHLNIPIEQILSASSWVWVTDRLRDLVKEFLDSTGVVNGDYSQRLLDIFKKSTFVTKSRKVFGHHIFWLSRQQRIAIGTAKCRQGYEFEIKTDETLGLCTLPGSSHKEDLNFRYEAVGIKDHLLANDIIYDLFVEMFKDCIVNGKLDDSSSNNSNNTSSNNSTSDSSSSNESSADFSAEDDKKKEKELVFFDLSPGGIKASAGYLSDLVVQGHRHWFHNYLGGMMFYCQISFESASEVVSLLCDMTTDREKDSRLRSLELTYAKGKMSKALRGSTSLAGLIVNTVPSFREVENPSAAGKTIMDILKTIWQGDIKANVVTDPDEDKKLSQRVIESLRPAISLLFKDDSDTAFAAINMDGGEHRNTVPIRNKRFNLWIRRKYYELAGDTLGTEIISEVVETLESEALFDGPIKKLEPRINKDPDDPFVYWYDLGNEEWSAIRITSEGWSIVESGDVPIIFRRYAGQLPQVMPSRIYSRDIFEQFMMLLNIKDDLQIRLVYQCYIISLFIPAIAKAVFIAQGPQGATKTTFQDLTKLVADPCKVTSVTPPRTEEQLMQLLQHNAIVYFDNMSHVPEWLSNAMCRAATGTAGLKRELYTNDDDIIYQYKRAIGFNGISPAANRADLLDRSFIVEIESVTDETRRTLEDDIMPELERIKPQLFGFILDTLVKMLHLKANGGIKLKNLSRMADFEKHCEMISRSLGHEPLEFVNAYRANKDIGTQDILENSSTANAILAFMGPRVDAWKGYASTLLNELETVALTKLKIDIQKDKSWPRNGSYLSRRLRELKHSLLKAGIMVFWEYNPIENRRYIVLGKVQPVPPVPPVNDDSRTNKTYCTGATGATGGTFAKSEEGDQKPTSDTLDTSDRVFADLKNLTYSDCLIDGVPIWQVENRGMNQEEAEAFKAESERLGKEKGAK